MIRVMLSDSVWEKPRKSIEFTKAYLCDNLCMCTEAILWHFRTASPWRDLPVGHRGHLAIPQAPQNPSCGFPAMGSSIIDSRLP